MSASVAYGERKQKRPRLTRSVLIFYSLNQVEGFFHGVNERFAA